MATRTPRWLDHKCAEGGDLCVVFFLVCRVPRVFPLLRGLGIVSALWGHIRASVESALKSHVAATCSLTCTKMLLLLTETLMGGNSKLSGQVFSRVDVGHYVYNAAYRRWVIEFAGFDHRASARTTGTLADCTNTLTTTGHLTATLSTAL